jgi:hypothetical protein
VGSDRAWKQTDAPKRAPVRAPATVQRQDTRSQMARCQGHSRGQRRGSAASIDRRRTTVIVLTRWVAPGPRPAPTSRALMLDEFESNQDGS